MATAASTGRFDAVVLYNGTEPWTAAPDMGFGGVSEKVTPDNLKAAIIVASFEDPLVNRAYRELAEHYEFLISPCLPGRPEHKGVYQTQMAHEGLSMRQIARVCRIALHYCKLFQTRISVGGTVKSALSARFHIVIPIALACAALLALGGCGRTTPVPDDTKPGFQGAVADQIYIVGQAINILTLPSATGGDGELTYGLDPTVPGLAFDRGARTLSGTPIKAGSYPMTYTVMDADDNTTDEDTAALTFTITVQEAERPDTAPMFEGTVDDQTYTAGEPIDDLTLPVATGGNGELRYTLEPTVPGLTFDPTERTLGGTLTVVGTYSMTYRVVDADENTGDNDDATLSFTITVGELVPPEYVGTWHFSGVPAPATVVFEQDRFLVTVGDGENAVVPTAPFDQITRIMVSGTLAAQDSTLTMTVADDGVELTFAAGVTPAQQEVLTQIVAALLMHADDAPASVVVEAGVITVTGGPIVALLLTTELDGDGGVRADVQRPGR